MYAYELRESLERELKKIARKSPELVRAISKKITEITNNVDASHYKNLRKPLQHLKRVHINKSFVLVFSVDELQKHIIFEDFDHHDNIYRK